MSSLILLALLAQVPAGFPVPLAPGTWWDYRESWTERLGGIDSITDAETRFEVRGSVDSPFLYQSGGDDPVAAPVETGEGWIRLGPWTGEDPLPVPLEVGRSGPSSEAGPGWQVEAMEEVTVPAGRFRALRCAFRTHRMESVLWIAPGVGVVREAHGPPGLRPDLERVLLAWSGGEEQPERDASKPE
ncbi:MAG: hypothetical protein LJF15_07220 [Acidobacteria bacterium]|nr:hypothetical protein [Acidobacteriota bacterium]